VRRPCWPWSARPSPWSGPGVRGPIPRRRPGCPRTSPSSFPSSTTTASTPRRSTIDELAALFSTQDAFSVRFDTCRRFPGVLYLAPAPHQPFRALTQAVTTRWPEAPPYGGQFPEVIPHLTVAHTQQPTILDTAETALTPRLPITADIASIDLFACDGNHWHRHTTFPLRGALRTI
jgi:hypothetical protein